MRKLMLSPEGESEHSPAFFLLCPMPSPEYQYLGTKPPVWAPERRTSDMLTLHSAPDCPHFYDLLGKLPVLFEPQRGQGC
jgi:hypothetical protein